MSNMIENTLCHYERKIKELEAKNGELERKLVEALNGTLLKRYNDEKEDALTELAVAVEALEYYANEHNYSGGYYSTTSSDCEDKAKEALEKIKGT